MRPVSVLFFLLLIACDSKVVTPTYRPYSSLYKAIEDERLKGIKSNFEALQKPVLKNVFQLDSNWIYMAGDGSEHLDVPCREVMGVQINLPHRILLPDTPLWYARTIHFTEPGYLFIQADDGGQLYLNKKRILRNSDYAFPIDTAGVYQVTVRVLNNAMAGGLRRISFVTKDQYDQYTHHLSLFKRAEKVIEKTLRKSVLMEEELDAVEYMLSNFNEDALKKTEEVFIPYPLLAGPYIIGGNDNLVRIRVQTDATFPVHLEWGSQPDQLNNKLTEDGPVTAFDISLPKPNTQYYYRINSENSYSEIIPVIRNEPSHKYAFNVWADSQSGWERFVKNINLITQTDDVFGIGVGDLVSQGNEEEHWRKFFSILSSSASSIPYYLIPGNHDYDGYYDDLNPGYYYSFTGNLKNYFSWSHANSSFISLDPNASFPIGFDDEQRIWFYNKIESEEWKSATWRFVLLHQPPYSQGWPDYHGDDVVRKLLDPVYESAKIDFVVSGHTHDYERLTKEYGEQKVTFLIVGGAGGALEPQESSSDPKMDTVIKQHHIGRFTVDGQKINFESISSEGEVLDAFQIKKDE